VVRVIRLTLAASTSLLLSAPSVLRAQTALNLPARLTQRLEPTEHEFIKVRRQSDPDLFPGVEVLLAARGPTSVSNLEDSRPRTAAMLLIGHDTFVVSRSEELGAVWPRLARSIPSTPGLTIARVLRLFTITGLISEPDLVRDSKASRLSVSRQRLEKPTMVDSVVNPELATYPDREEITFAVLKSLGLYRYRVTLRKHDQWSLNVSVMSYAKMRM
jgi:hypothetical protein